MAFNLKKVLRALLFSTNQALSVKDIQAAFARFHEQSVLPPQEGEDVEAGEQSVGPSSSERGPEAQVIDEVPAEVPALDNPLALAPEDPELYQDVPSLITATQIREVMDEIAAELKLAENGLMLIDGSNGYQLVTEPHYARWLRILRNEPPPVKLSQSALETLAVIAYRQPVTRTEIEHIRGVSAEAGVNKLLERELIYIVGRADLPGRPLQYGTTDKFLEFIGIKSLEELPASDVLSNRQIDEWLQKATNTKAPTDAEMGLPLEPSEGGSTEAITQELTPETEEVVQSSAPQTGSSADDEVSPSEPTEERPGQSDAERSPEP